MLFSRILRMTSIVLPAGRLLRVSERPARSCGSRNKRAFKLSTRAHVARRLTPLLCKLSLCFCHILPLLNLGVARVTPNAVRWLVRLFEKCQLLTFPGSLLSLLSHSRVRSFTRLKLIRRKSDTDVEISVVQLDAHDHPMPVKTDRTTRIDVFYPQGKANRLTRRKGSLCFQLQVHTRGTDVSGWALAAP
jgi:hypothetical protein